MRKALVKKEHIWYNTKSERGKKMFKVIETFSGIGSQAKALENIGIKHEILCTADWDINAIIAYDLIHNGKQDLEKYEKMSKEEMQNKLSKYTLSMNGKKPATEMAIKGMNSEVLKRLLSAIERTNNLVSITDIKGTDLPSDVSAILTERHRKNFEEWQDYLKSIGYYNKIYTLNASNFGIPQKRVRTYMISIFTNSDIQKEKQIDRYFNEHDLEKKEYLKKIIKKSKNLKDDILKLNYKNKQYKMEADECQPNDTQSRREIYQNNDILYTNKKVNNIIVSTVTTKQDRHPNSGLIDYKSEDSSKSKYRYLTPRECFLLMGFDEEDYQRIIDNNFKSRKNEMFFSRDKLYKMAGNSIVVNVLEEIFRQIIQIEEILEENQFNAIQMIKEKIEIINNINGNVIKKAIYN